MAKKKKAPVVKEPILVESLTNSGTLRCLAFDPGTKNFACSVVEAKLGKRGEFKFRILGTRMFDNCVTQPNAYLRSQAFAFKKELATTIKKAGGNFDISIAERFQSRGQGGHTIESINIMLGIMVTNIKTEDMRIITAATWKNAFNRSMDLKALYQLRKSYEVPKTDHEFDATMIGLYRLQQVLGLKPFDHFDADDGVKLLEKYLRAPKLKV